MSGAKLADELKPLLAELSVAALTELPDDLLEFTRRWASERLGVPTWKAAPSLPLIRSKWVKTRSDPIEQDYELSTEQVGEGAYGAVFLVRHRVTGLSRALKTVEKQHVDSRGYLHEIEILRLLDHPNVVKLHELFEDSGCLQMVMEMCRGGELFNAIVDEDYVPCEGTAIHVARQMLASVHYIHSAGICHRDIKPENYLLANESGPLESNVIKLIDFGLADFYPRDGSAMEFAAGTPTYAAPEVFKGSYHHSCDCWSVGCVVYMLLCGFPPFGGDTEEETLELVQAGDYTFEWEEFETVSAEAKDLIAKLLDKDPQSRLTAKQALEQPWLWAAPRDSIVSNSRVIFDDIRRFRRQRGLKQACLHVVAAQLDEHQIRTQLRELFVAMDRDGDGYLTSQELRQALTTAKLVELPEELETDLKEFEGSDEGLRISYTEFLAATLDRRMLLQADVCRAAFDVFDADGDGQISRGELQKVLSDKRVRATVSEERLVGLMLEADTNGDGLIDFREFQKMISKPDDSPTARRPSARRSSRQSFMSCPSLASAGSFVTASQSLPFLRLGPLEVAGRGKFSTAEELSAWLGRCGLAAGLPGARGHKGSARSLLGELQSEACLLEVRAVEHAMSSSSSRRSSLGAGRRRSSLSSVLELRRVRHELRAMVFSPESKEEGNFVFKRWCEEPGLLRQERNEPVSLVLGVHELPLPEPPLAQARRVLAEHFHALQDWHYRLADPVPSDGFGEVPLQVLSCRLLESRVEEAQPSDLYPGLLDELHVHVVEIVCEGLPEDHFTSILYKTPSTSGGPRRLGNDAVARVCGWSWYSAPKALGEQLRGINVLESREFANSRHWRELHAALRDVAGNLRGGLEQLQAKAPGERLPAGDLLQVLERCKEAAERASKEHGCLIEGDVQKYHSPKVQSFVRNTARDATRMDVRLQEANSFPVTPDKCAKVPSETCRGLNVQ